MRTERGRAIRPKDIDERRRARWAEGVHRWRERGGLRTDRLKRVHRREDADSPERVASFARREAARATASARLRAAVLEASRDTADERAFVRFVEGKVGPTLDWSFAPSTMDAARAGRPVARLCSEPTGARSVGFATGFLVSSRLLLTNHHVLSAPSDAVGAFANFLHEQRDGAVTPGLFFELDPDSLFLADADLDLALVAVAPHSHDETTDLAELGHLRLLAETGKVLVGHPITIIQHPDGGPKTFADTQNRLLDVLDHYLHYSTDTLPGSSGAPCFNRSWELVALHHCGIPRMRNGDVLTISDQPWDGQDIADVAWDANEGVRATVVRAHLQRRRTELEPGAQAMLDEAVLGMVPWRTGERPENTPVVLQPGRSPSTNRNVSVARSSRAMVTVESPSMPLSTPETTMSQHSIHVHGEHATVYVSCSFDGQPSSPTAPKPPGAAFEKKLRFDPDYDARAGYDPTFLGVEIPLPTVAASRASEILKGLDGKPLVLRYHHFSIVMNEERFLQMWSAVNVDYSAALRAHSQNREAFGRDTWISDPRVPDDYQLLDADFYAPAKRIDRGHVVRREDNAWGATFEETEHANSDTFHWTNCTPQHERFNQSRLSGRWGSLEDEIKAQSAANAPRLSIFAGPVLAEDDPEALGIRYPVRFWKVVAAIVDGALAAYGFVLDQSDVVSQYGLGLERLDFGKFRGEQRSLAHIEQISGVRFAKVLGEADVLLGDPTPIDLMGPEGIRLRRAPAADPGPPA